ncbi:MAG: glycosyltransferase [Nibricoccus sp.]
MEISVIICAHNPDRSRLHRTLDGLRLQTLPPDRWETLLVDNASSPEISRDELAPHAPVNLRILRESALGLTSARRTGLRAATAGIVILVDDDNVLAPDYLEQTLAVFTRLPRVGAIGGKSIPEFSSTIQRNDWRREFFPLLALRDLGEVEQISTGLRPPGAEHNQYPAFAPIGAGMALRLTAVAAWLNNTSSALSDRRGTELTSAGDNDLIFSVLQSGWEVAYIPALSLTHLIPPSRLTPQYLARLNHGIQKSWAQLLLLHDSSPWPPIARWTLPLRRLKAWFSYRAWSSHAALIRWSGACGHFDGRASQPRKT